jgi:peptidoglycan hydrolase-like protein with peptidoglycan-binding domain
MTLTPTQLQKACKNNPLYKQQLGDSWLGYKASQAAIDSPEYAQAAADFQGSLKLTADGMWGPTTNEAAGKLTLTPSEVDYAIERNPYWQQQLGSQWAGGLISAQPVDSPLFAEDVYAFQESKSLGADGICGPETNAEAADIPYVPPDGTEYILISGKHEPCDFKVISPDEDGAMVFTKGFYPDPLLLPTLFILHWDGCRTSRSCYDVLCARNLSVQFMLDGDEEATIFQGLDPADGTCWHAGSVNRRAWGVEICNPVYLKYQDLKRPRPISTMQVRGDRSKILGFYPAQIDKVVKLCHWVCDYAGIPKQLPALKGQPGKVYNSYIQGPGPAWLINNFTGVAAHFHQDNNKCDPAMELWEALTASGFAIVEV